MEYETEEVRSFKDLTRNHAIRLRRGCLRGFVARDILKVFLMPFKGQKNFKRTTYFLDRFNRLSKEMRTHEEEMAVLLEKYIQSLDVIHDED